jgi:hypothetical protein
MLYKDCRNLHRGSKYIVGSYEHVIVTDGANSVAHKSGHGFSLAYEATSPGLVTVTLNDPVESILSAAATLELPDGDSIVSNCLRVVEINATNNCVKFQHGEWNDTIGGTKPYAYTDPQSAIAPDKTVGGIIHFVIEANESEDY